MLETDEVDDDYFTPMGRTSLASIFKKPNEKTENETLKYSPPVPKVPPREDNQQSKRIYDNIFSCVFDAYQWLDNVYTHKGKLGCAIVRLTTSESLQFHSILLYDSKKSTISSAATTKEFEVTVKGKDFISYYDRFGKYWCLYGSEDDIKKIVDILKSFGVKIKVSQESENVLPEQNKPERLRQIKSTNIKNIGSDTDSSINRKTKASILNRMANMGQSVLPSRTTSHAQTSNSSDTESDNNVIAVRSKPIKNSVKRNILEKPLNEKRKTDALVQCTQQSMESKMYMTNDQLIPLQSSSTITSAPGNDLNFFITEQRITNSELRINMARITDKVDNIINKINGLEIRDKDEGSTNINSEILQKLLKEYESKIKTYEELFKKVNNDSVMTQKSPTKNSFEEKDKVLLNNELQMLKNKVNELDKCIKQKDEDISKLNNQIEIFRERDNSRNLNDDADEYKAKISALEEELSEKTKLVEKLSVQNEEFNSKKSDDQLENNIKTIMNDTFQAVAVNFNNNESYSGETIKNIIATVIKKVTMESLNKSK